MSRKGTALWCVRCQRPSSRPMSGMGQFEKLALAPRTSALTPFYDVGSSSESLSSRTYPRPQILPYNPLTALHRRVRVDRRFTGRAGGAWGEIRVRSRPAEPQGSRYVRPTGTTGLPLVETALRVGRPTSRAFSAASDAPCRRVEIGDRKTPRGAPGGRQQKTMRGTRQAPRSLLAGLMTGEAKTKQSLGPMGRGKDAACPLTLSSLPDLIRQPSPPTPTRVATLRNGCPGQARA